MGRCSYQPLGPAGAHRQVPRSRSPPVASRSQPGTRKDGDARSRDGCLCGWAQAPGAPRSLRVSSNHVSRSGAWKAQVISAWTLAGTSLWADPSGGDFCKGNFRFRILRFATFMSIHEGRLAQRMWKWVGAQGFPGDPAGSRHNIVSGEGRLDLRGALLSGGPVTPLCSPAPFWCPWVTVPGCPLLPSPPPEERGPHASLVGNMHAPGVHSPLGPADLRRPESQTEGTELRGSPWRELGSACVSPRFSEPT